ncbi:MAG: DUF4174 domain-containing protein [Geminicoccaceae bacterium]
MRRENNPLKIFLWARSVIISAVFFGVSHMAYANGLLDIYNWQNRIVVVIADAHTTEQLAEQHRMLLADPDGLQDRDLIIVTVERELVQVDGVENTSIRADHLRDALNVPDQGYSTLLIGKDGGVKLRSRQPVRTEDLFALIDGMPMRQREMRGHPSDRRR